MVLKLKVKLNPLNITTMEILKVNYEIGKKCFMRFNNAFRECIFLGTKGVKNEKGCVVSYYILNIAGVGETLVKFDRFNQFDKWYHSTLCNTILYPTLEDCKNKTNCITAMYGSTDNCYNGKFMKQFFPECSVCNCGGTIYGWAWNGTDAVVVSCRLTSAEYSIDENGFHKEGRVMSCSYTDSYNFCGDLGKIYPTKAACIAEHEANVVTF